MLNGVGAVLIAAGQEIVGSVTAMWLRAHELFLVSLVGGGDVNRISGIDDQMDRAVKKTDGWLASAGRCSSPASSYRSFRIFGMTDGERCVSR